jgi:hypothetical protein
MFSKTKGSAFLSSSIQARARVRLMVLARFVGFFSQKIRKCVLPDDEPEIQIACMSGNVFVDTVGEICRLHSKEGPTIIKLSGTKVEKHSDSENCTIEYQRNADVYESSICEGTEWPISSIRLEVSRDETVHGHDFPMYLCETEVYLNQDRKAQELHFTQSDIQALNPNSHCTHVSHRQYNDSFQPSCSDDSERGRMTLTADYGHYSMATCTRTDHARVPTAPTWKFDTNAILLASGTCPTDGPRTSLSFSSRPVSFVATHAFAASAAAVGAAGTPPIDDIAAQRPSGFTAASPRVAGGGDSGDSGDGGDGGADAQCDPVAPNWLLLHAIADAACALEAGAPVLPGAG